MGEIGRRMVEREERMAMDVFVGLLMYHCFMWLAEFGGRVIVA